MACTARIIQAFLFFIGLFLFSKPTNSAFPISVPGQDTCGNEPPLTKAANNSYIFAGNPAIKRTHSASAALIISALSTLFLSSSHPIS